MTFEWRIVPCLVISALVASAWQPDRAAGQAPRVWGELEPGKYAVGYRIDFEVDRSRGYRPAVDWLGRGDSVETGRPMQISIWYPAKAGVFGTEPMTYGDYVRTQAGALGPEFDTPERRREFELALMRGPLSPYFEDGVSENDLVRVLKTPMAAVRGARPADGRFPVVIHGGASLSGQTVLLEYLASHGFVVMSVPLLGTAPAWFGRGQGTPEYYQAGADDVGYLHAHAHEIEFSDPSRTAMIGMFSAFGLLVQMQHMRLRAIAALDGSYAPALRQIPGFDSVAFRIPILDMPRSNPTNDRSILDGLRHAEQYRAKLDDAEHGDFYQFRRMARPEHAADDTVYRTVAETTRRFLHHVLASGTLSAADSVRSTFPSDSSPAGVERVSPEVSARPTAEEFLLLIREGRIDEARRAWHEMDCRAAACAPAPEGDMTVTLFFLRRDVGAAAALDGFQLLADMFPESDDARRHLAATRHAAGDE